MTEETDQTHRPGSRAMSPELRELEATFGVRLRSHRMPQKLYRAVKNSAEAQEYLKQRVSNANRWDAFISGGTQYTAKAPCERCGSMRRQVINNGCVDCQVARRPPIKVRPGVWSFHAVNRGANVAKATEKRRAAAKEAELRGEYLGASFGPFEARLHPTDRLEVHAPGLGIAFEDIERQAGFDGMQRLYREYPEDFPALLRWAGRE